MVLVRWDIPGVDPNTGKPTGSGKTSTPRPMSADAADRATQIALSKAGQGYVPSTAATFKSTAPSVAAASTARPHPVSQDWWRGDPDGTYSWSDLGRDLGSYFSGSGTNNGPTPGQKAAAVDKTDLPDNVVLDGLNMYGQPVDMSVEGWELEDAKTLTWNNETGKQDVGFDVKQTDSKGKTQYGVQGIGFDTDFQADPNGRGRVKVIDESTDKMTWGDGYQMMSKEDVLAQEPVVITPEAYDRLGEAEKRLVDYNTLVLAGEADDGLAERLGLDLSKGMFTKATMQSFANDGDKPAVGSAGEADAYMTSRAVQKLVDEMQGTSSTWEYATIDQQLTDFLGDKLRQEKIDTGAPLTQADQFEIMFNDLADLETFGDWSADELASDLTALGYDPDEFWNWAGQRLVRFKQAELAGQDVRLTSGTGKQLDADGFAKRLNISLGG